eukprot:TRINITY_DN6289_c1_g1_i1.p1 TRINITY_DN6289_c1_g1~~TRINITY_DN6289_c1_g1_i1.p1  ORF type:complete len:903 (-),score=186.41 TRINITY_DN6289_c1_g1_i1:528-3119(-)
MASGKDSKALNFGEEDDFNEMAVFGADAAPDLEGNARPFALRFQGPSEVQADLMRRVRQRHLASPQRLGRVGTQMWRKKRLSPTAVLPSDPSDSVDQTIKKSVYEHEMEVISHQEAMKKTGFWTTLYLAYSSIGVIYGDVGTSPLYTYAGIFAEFETVTQADIHSGASMIFWMITLICLVKYVFIVLYADDHGEGGTFALYSNLCRHAKLSLLGNEVHPEVAAKLERKYRQSLEKSPSEKGAIRRTKAIIEGSPFIRRALLILVLIGTCGVLADGVLTPAISVLSAVQGVEFNGPNFSNTVALAITSVVLGILFFFQRFGTDRVGFVFAPVCVLWFSAIAAIGFYNIFKHEPTIFKVINPGYIVDYFRRHGAMGWRSLGGVILCITGTEALFADMGHFSRKSIQLAFSCVVYPALIITYFGQAAYLHDHLDHVSNTFYASIPDPFFYPMLALSTAAATVASQAMISGSFSIIKQSMSLKCFPPLSIIHTSNVHHGQVYIPVVNWVLFALNMAVIWGFRNGVSIGNAYGVTVLSVMLLTTTLISMVMLVSWEWRVQPVICFWLFFAVLEGVNLSATLDKVPQGGWFPIVMATILLSIMYTWHFGQVKAKQHDEQVEAVVKLSTLDEIMKTSGILAPSMMICYAEREVGVPAVFSHFITNIPIMPQVGIFLTVKNLPVPKLNEEDRFAIFPLKLTGFYRVIAYYGYSELIRHDEFFPELLAQHMIKMFESHGKEKVPSPGTSGGMMGEPLIKPVLREGQEEEVEEVEEGITNVDEDEESGSGHRRMVRDFSETTTAEIQNLMNAVEYGTVYMTARVDLTPKSWNPVHRLMLEAYRVFKALSGDEAGIYHIPRGSSVEVGMVYEVN